MRFPLSCNNHLIHFITQTEPLTITLDRKVKNLYFTLTLPKQFSRLKPSFFKRIPLSPPDYVSFKNVPSSYWTLNIPFSVSPSPIVRRQSFLDLCDDVRIIDYCSRK